MKHLRLLGLAAMAATAFAVFGAGSASADLYTDAGKTSKYKTGTTLSASLATGKSSAWKSGGTTVATCTSGSIHGTTSNETGTVSSTISSETWGGCSQTTHILQNGFLSITTTGSVVGTGTKVTFTIFGVTCSYGTGEGVILGSLTSGQTPILKFNAVLPRLTGGFLCPSSVAWEAEYVITEPHALYVG